MESELNPWYAGEGFEELQGNCETPSRTLRGEEKDSVSGSGVGIASARHCSNVSLRVTLWKEIMHVYPSINSATCTCVYMYVCMYTCMYTCILCTCSDR